MKKHEHHIIPKHDWKRRYGSLENLDETGRGIDDPINLVLLTTKQHAKAHKLLWEQNGYIDDYIAWKSLSGQIGREEAHRLIMASPEVREKLSKAQVGRKRGPMSKETKEKISRRRKGKGLGPRQEWVKEKIRNTLFGHSVSKESRKKMSQWERTPEMRNRMSESQKRRFAKK